MNTLWLILQFGCAEAPLLVLRAKELPRGALVEFQVNLHTGRQSPDSGSGQIPLAESVHAAQDHHSDQSPGGGPSREEDEDDIEDDEEQLEPTHAAGADGEISWESCVTSGNRNRGSRAVIFVSGEIPASYLASHAGADTRQISRNSRMRPLALYRKTCSVP